MSDDSGDEWGGGQPPKRERPPLAGGGADLENAGNRRKRPRIVRSPRRPQAFAWILAGSGKLWFLPRDDGSSFDVDYETWGSAGFVVNDLPLEAAKAAVRTWLVANEKTRLRVIAGGRAS